VTRLPAADSVPATTNASPTRTKDNVEFVIGPVYANAAELTVKDGVPRGALHEFTMNAEESKIYPGIGRRQPGTVPYKRKVAVYVPKIMWRAALQSFIVVQDTSAIPTPWKGSITIHERASTLIAIFINSGGGDAQAASADSNTTPYSHIHIHRD
jgi:hypothetical protein